MLAVSLCSKQSNNRLNYGALIQILASCISLNEGEVYKSLKMVNAVQFDAKIKKKSDDGKLQLTQAYFLSILTYFNARLRMDYCSMHDKKRVLSCLVCFFLMILLRLRA